MGDLKSKLRAKLARRHSGVPSLSSARSNTSAGSDGMKDAASATGAPEHQRQHQHQHDGSSNGSNGSHTRQTARLSGAQWAEKLKLGAKHLAAGALGDTTGGDANGNVTDNGDADIAAAAAAAAPAAARPSSAASSQKHASAKNAGPTNNSLPPASPVPGSRDGQGPNGNDHRHLTQLSSVSEASPATEENAAAGQHLQPIEEDKPPRSSTDAVRRQVSVRINDDPPASSDPSGPTARPAVPGQAFAVDPTPTPNTLRPSNSLSRPAAPPRRQSLLPSRQTTLIRTLLSAGQADEFDQGPADQLLPINANMVTRKLWVKRPGASATLVTINEEDLVDDVRELILRKYGNSLGRQFDAPDLTLRIVPREGARLERVLGPEEPMTRTLDAYFPGGQTVEEALLIDVPHRRTPRASPRNGPPHAQHITSVNYEEIRPLEASTDYFGPGAIAHIPVTIAGAPNGATHSISVLNTGQVPQIPSPGGGTSRSRQYRERVDRPRLGRQHTSSPTILNVVGAGGHTATIAVAANHGMHPPAPSNPRSSRTHSSASLEQQQANAPPAPPAPPLPTPPSQDSGAAVPLPMPIARTSTPPPPSARAASPRPQPAARPKKKKTADSPALPAGMLNGGVPPINVLIVEDNPINLRLLEAFIKRLKVRWQTAMNGREAVNKWRTGGFHLVLMDIQLPVMSGLEATREIRRLERMNSIGVFSTGTTNGVGMPEVVGEAEGEAEVDSGETPQEDLLQNRELFKSPVIIVALTASSLQSDRHEALAAGCNDFLTKPVTYVWLERKVMEWGCMQALIDFDGWRKWKAYSTGGKIEGGPDDGPASAKKAKSKKNRGVGPNSSSSDGQ